LLLGAALACRLGLLDRPGGAASGLEGATRANGSLERAGTAGLHCGTRVCPGSSSEAASSACLEDRSGKVLPPGPSYPSPDGRPASLGVCFAGRHSWVYRGGDGPAPSRTHAGTGLGFYDLRFVPNPGVPGLCRTRGSATGLAVVVGAAPHVSRGHAIVSGIW